MRYSRDIRALISHSMRENAVLVAVVLLHLAVAVLLARHYHFHVALDWSVQLPLFITCYLLLLVPAYFWMLARHRPARPIRFTTELLKRWRPHERLVVALPALVALGVFISAFGSLKSAIPRMEPYHLDPLFSHMDTAIHGEAPWRLLQPILGHPLFSFILNGAYELWMAVFYLALCAVAIWVDELELRRRFLHPATRLPASARREQQSERGPGDGAGDESQQERPTFVVDFVMHGSSSAPPPVRLETVR